MHLATQARKSEFQRRRETLCEVLRWSNLKLCYGISYDDVILHTALPSCHTVCYVDGTLVEGTTERTRSLKQTEAWLCHQFCKGIRLGGSSSKNRKHVYSRVSGSIISNSRYDECSPRHHGVYPDIGASRWMLIALGGDSGNNSTPWFPNCPTCSSIQPEGSGYWCKTGVYSVRSVRGFTWRRNVVQGSKIEG